MGGAVTLPIPCGYPVTIRTYDDALKWILNLANATGTLARWLLRLSEMDFYVGDLAEINHCLPSHCCGNPQLLKAASHSRTHYRLPWTKPYQKIKRKGASNPTTSSTMATILILTPLPRDDSPPVQFRREMQIQPHLGWRNLWSNRRRIPPGNMAGAFGIPGLCYLYELNATLVRTTY